VTSAGTEGGANVGQRESTEDKALARLIFDAKDKRRLSYRDMYRRAEEAGYYISYQQIANYAQGLVRKAPDPEQVAAISAAIGEPVERVRDAMFSQYYGYTPGQPPTIHEQDNSSERAFEDVVDNDPRLDEDASKLLVDTYRYLTAATAHRRGKA
jgi:hypothetical protein